MKKTMYLVLTTGCLLLAVATAQGHSEWAVYKTRPVPENATLPKKFINSDGTLDCCGCHWNTRHAGPAFCREQ